MLYWSLDNQPNYFTAYYFWHNLLFYSSSKLVQLLIQIMTIFNNLSSNQSHSRYDLINFNYCSFEMQIPCPVKFHCRNYAGNKLQENKQSKMTLHLLVVLSHCVWHILENVSVLAWMNCWHWHVFHEGEGFDG